MLNSTSILIYGNNIELLQLRKLVLETTGYFVWITTDIRKVEEHLLMRRVDLLVLCHSLSTEECERVSQLISVVQPETKVLALSAVGSGCKLQHDHATCDTLDGPAKLVATVTRLVETGTLNVTIQ